MERWIAGNLAPREYYRREQVELDLSRYLLLAVVKLIESAEQPYRNKAEEAHVNQLNRIEIGV